MFVITSITACGSDSSETSSSGSSTTTEAYAEKEEKVEETQPGTEEIFTSSVTNNDGSISSNNEAINIDEEASQENYYEDDISSIENMTGKELMSLYPDGWKRKDYIEYAGLFVTLIWEDTYTYVDLSSAYTDAQMQTISDYWIQCAVDIAEEACMDDDINSISVRIKQKDSNGNIIYTRTTSVQYTPSGCIIREW